MTRKKKIAAGATVLALALTGAAAVSATAAETIGGSTGSAGGSSWVSAIVPLRIQKVDAVTGEPLAGAEFRIDLDDESQGPSYDKWTGLVDADPLADSLMADIHATAASMEYGSPEFAEWSARLDYDAIFAFRGSLPETLVDASGEVPDSITVTTGEDGYATFWYVALAEDYSQPTLTVTETQAPDGYLLPTVVTDVPGGVRLSSEPVTLTLHASDYSPMTALPESEWEGRSGVAGDAELWDADGNVIDTSERVRYFQVPVDGQYGFKLYDLTPLTVTIGNEPVPVVVPEEEPAPQPEPEPEALPQIVVNG